MVSKHFALSSELTGAIAKRLPHAKNQLSVRQFLQSIRYIYTVEHLYPTPHYSGIRQFNDFPVIQIRPV